MQLGRTIMSSMLAISLAACGGGGGGSGGSPTGGGTSGGGTSGGGTGTTSCSLSARQDWALAALNEWYLFPDLLNTAVNKGAHTSVESYIDALVAPARAANRDRYFTYITSIAEETALINSGASAGFGIRLAYDEGARRVMVVEAFENAPGFAAGIDRGTEILAINGQAVSTMPGTDWAFAVSNALGPSNPGVSRTLRVRDTSGVERDVSVTKADFALDPISDRNGVQVFEVDGTKVGYVNLRSFIVQSAGPQLRAAFQRFKNEGVTRVILDLRYNGGGLISVAELLGDLLGADKTGQVFSKTVFRPSKSANDETSLFLTQPEAIAATRIAVIGREGTASASEMVANAFIPYLGTGLGLIGTNTYGKPVGQIALDRTECDDRLRAVALRTVNSAGGGDYYTGLASVMPATCRAEDGISTPLGDPSEASISVALDFLAGRSCTAIGSAATSRSLRTAAPEPERLLLRPSAPSAAQYQIPGLF